jgi:hypothetical protein
VLAEGFGSFAAAPFLGLPRLLVIAGIANGVLR